MYLVVKLYVLNLIGTVHHYCKTYDESTSVTNI